MLPRNIAPKAAFENAMTLDVAMGGSTNTVLHLLAAAREAEVDFTMADIDRIFAAYALSGESGGRQRRTITSRMCITGAGGIMGILAERRVPGNRYFGVDRARTDPGEAIGAYDVKQDVAPEIIESFRALPSGAYLPRLLFPRMRATRRWTMIVPTAAFATRPMPIHRMVVWLCCTATLLWMAVS